MDIKAYTEVLHDINTLAGRLLHLCGEDVINELDEAFIVRMLKMRLDILNNIKEFDNENDKVELLILMLIGVCAKAKGEHGVDLTA